MSAPLRYFDRLARCWSSHAPAYGVSGQYILEGASGVSRPEVDAWVLLVDHGDDSVEIQDGDARRTVVLLHGDSDASANACAEVAATVGEWRALGVSWREIVAEVAPLIQVAGVSDRLQEDRLELAFDRHLPELRHVFLSPISELQFDVERLPVARARRVSRRATQVLAARTEDWLKVGAGGVTPRRIESLVREEVVDLYENRVAARLLDEVHRHLKRMLSVYDQLDELVAHEIVGWWRRQYRLADLWGSQPPGDDLRALLARRRHYVERLLTATARLRDGRLYKEVPVRARVQQPIRVTNLFAEDPNYRAVRHVWQEWWRSRSDQTSVEERRSNRLLQAAGFDGFAWLTLAHALRRMESSDLDVSDRISAADVVASTPWGEVGLATLPPQEGTGWRLSIGEPGGVSPRRAAVVIPLACELLAGPEGAVRERLTLIEQSLGARIQSENVTVVLYPGSGHDLRQLPDAIQKRGNSVPPAHASETTDLGVWVIPISPLDLESVERVERALRWVLLSERLSRYPVHSWIPTISRHLFDDLRQVEVSGTRGDVTLRGIPSSLEWSDVTRRIDSEIRRLAKLPRQQGAHEVAELRSAVDRLNSCIGDLRILARCPVCSAVGDLVSRSAATYEVTCRECRARWGLRHIPSSGDRAPYVWIADDPSEEEHIRGLDRWLGRDVLSEPCRHPDVTYGSELINPADGKCTASIAITESCKRCASRPNA